MPTAATLRSASSIPLPVEDEPTPVFGRLVGAGAGFGAGAGAGFGAGQFVLVAVTLSAVAVSSHPALVAAASPAVADCTPSLLVAVTSPAVAAPGTAVGPASCAEVAATTPSVKNSAVTRAVIIVRIEFPLLSVPDFYVDTIPARLLRR